MTIRFILSILSLTLLSLEAAPRHWFPPILPAEEAQKKIEALNNELVGRRPNAEEYFELGALYLLNTPNTSLATNYLRQAVRLGVDDPFAGLLYTIVLERRGDYAYTLPVLLNVCSRHPDGVAGELALRSVRSYMGYVSGFNKKVEPMMRKLLRKEALNPQASFLARDILADILAQQKNPDEYHECLQDMGRIRRWHVAGPFGHLPTLDFDKTFAPETEKEPRAEYENDVRGFYEDFPEASIRPFGKHRRKGTFYGTTWIRTLLSRKVIVRIDSADNLRLSVDGKEMFVRDGRRDWQRTDAAIVLNLKEGWHKLVVKCSSESAPSGFHLYVTDEYGKALRGAPGGNAEFKAQPEQAGFIDEKPQPLNRTAEAACDEILAGNPKDAWANFVKAWLASEAGNTVEARVLAERCIEAAPDFAEFHFYLARYLKDDYSVSTEESSSRARQSFQKAAQLADEFALALDEASDFDIDEDHPDRAIKTLEHCVAINPDYWGFHLGLYTAYRAKGWNDMATESLERAFKDHQEGERLLNIGIKWYKDRRNYRRVRECLDALDRINPRSSERARNWIALGRFKEAAREYQRLSGLMPKEASYKFALADMYRRMGKSEDARSVLTDLLEDSVSPATVQRALATLQFETGNEEEASKAIFAAHEEVPTDLSMRQSALELGQEDEIEPYRVTLAEVLKERDSKKQYPGVSTVYMLDQFVARILPDGSSLELTHIIAKVLDKGGVQRMGEISIPRGSRIYFLRVIKPNGETLEPEISTKKSSYTMSGLAPGDVVQYEYLHASGRITIPNAYPGANFTFNSIEIPTERAQLVLMTPAKFPLKYHFRNAKVKPKIKKKGDLAHYEWNMKNPTAVHREPRAVPYQEFIPHVQFSGGLNWDSVRRHYYNRLYPRLKLSPEMKADTSKAIEGLTDPLRKAEAIFRMVEKRVKTPGSSVSLNTSAHLVYSMRGGNMLVVLKSLYDHAGIPSDIVFTYSQTQALPVLEVPSLGTYRYGLLRLHLGDNRKWIDPTSRKMPFGYLPPALGGTKGLRISDDGDTFIEIPEPPSEQDQLFTRWTADVSAQGAIKSVIEESYSGSLAGAIRRVEETYTLQQWTQFIERNVNYSIPGATVSGLKILNVDNYKKPVVLRYQFAASRFARREGDYLRVGKLIGRSNMIRRYAAIPGRHIPLLLQNPMNRRVETRLKFPKGSTIKDTPQPMKRIAPQGRYDVAVKENGEVFEMTRTIRLPIQRVQPVAYRSFQSLCRAIDQNEIHEIVVQVGGD
ncbi:MAG: DUF3857 domain-containing protein [Planctomycetota bacterium]|nr:DUF3857 domain-containing protein [Planctomycetota bacterium]